MQNIVDIHFLVCYLIYQRDAESIVYQNLRKENGVVYEKPET